MSFRKLLVLFAAFAVLSLISAQCVVAPTPEKVVETVVVTQEVEAAVEESEVQELRVAAAFFAGTGFGGIGGGGDMAELDPVRRGTWSFHSLLWTPLIAGDTEGNIIPEKSLAESYEVSEDGTVYTFHLRPDAKYSDGTPITAQHVVDVFGYVALMTHPEARGWRDNYGPGKRFFWDIVGFLDATQEENCPYQPFGVCEVEGIKALDDHTVEITLTEPSESFIRRVQVSIGIFHPEDMLAGMEADYDMLDFWTAHARNSGPYKVNRFRSGEGYEMVPNEYYFGPKPKITKINVLAVSQDVNTILTAFANKELDMVPYSIPGSAVRQAMSDPNMSSTMVQIPTWIVNQFWVTPNPPLDDIHVRRAFSMALDREVLLNVLNAGADQPLHLPTNMHRSEFVPHCEEETAAVGPLPFDPEMAKAELEQSKYWPDVLDMEIHLWSQNPILTAFANKELDMVPYSIPGSAVRQAMSDPNMSSTMVQIPTWIVNQFWVTPNPPLDDIHVRRAFSMALDREVLLNVLNAGADQPLHLPTNMHRSEFVPHCEEETAAVGPLPFDPEMAKAELEQSKYWPDVLDMEIHLWSQNPGDLAQLEVLQTMLQENLGMNKVTIHTEVMSDPTNPPYPLHIWFNNQQPWYPDLTDTLGNMTKNMKDKPWEPDDKRQFNDVAYEPDLRDLIDQAKAENDPAKKCELVGQAGQKWNDTAFSLDFGVQMGYYLIQPWVQGDLQWYGNAGQGKPMNIEDWWVAKH